MSVKERYLVLIILLIFTLVTGLFLVNQAEENALDAEKQNKNLYTLKPIYTRKKIVPVHILALLFKELKFDVFEVRSPINKDDLESLDIVYILNPVRDFSRNDTNLLYSYVENGGTLIIQSKNTLNFYNSFGISNKATQKPGSINLNPAPLTKFLNFILTKPGARLSYNFHPEATPIPIAVDKATNSIYGFLIPYGKGRIYILSSKNLDSRKSLTFINNLLLFVNPAYAYAKPNRNTIGFYNTIPSVFAMCDVPVKWVRVKAGLSKKKYKYDSWWGIIKANPVSITLFQIILVSILLLYSTAAKRKPPRKYIREKRLISREHFDAMAKLYQQTACYNWALDQIYFLTKRRLAKHLKLPIAVSNEELAKKAFKNFQSQLAINLKSKRKRKITIHSEKEIYLTLENAENLRSQKISEKKLIAMAKKLYILRKEILPDEY